MNLKLLLRKYFPIILNFLHLAPRFWKNNSSYFVAVDYHYITSNQIQHPTLEVQSSILENQLMFFSESIDVINPKKFGDDYFQNKKSRLSLLITIDDADYSVKENLHLFEKYNIPILIFAPFGLCLDQNSRNGLISRILRAFFEIKDYSGNKDTAFKEEFFNKVITSSDLELNDLYRQMKSKRDDIDPLSSRKLLSIEELTELSKNPLVTVSSHSMSHPLLSQISQDWLEWEINTSLEYLTKVNGDKRFFAYPYGFKDAINQSVKTQLRNAGVKYAFTTRSNGITESSDPLEYGRVGMLNFESKAHLKGLAGNAFEYYDLLLNR